MKAKEGSITVFLSLTLVLVLSFLFSLLEAARVQCLKSQSEINAFICMESMYGNYNVNLWKDYHLLFLDGTWRKDDFSMDRFSERSIEEARKNLEYEEGYGNYLEVKNIEVMKYALATDHQGKVLRRQACKQMKREGATDVIKNLLQLEKEKEVIENKKKEIEMDWENAWDAIENAENMQIEETKGQNLKGGKIEEVIEAEMENPMHYVKSIRKSSILGLVLEDISELSGKAVKKGDSLKDRVLYEGNIDKVETGITDRMWFQYYISQYFSDFVTTKSKGAKEKALSYEIEYIIGGKEEDVKNLEKVVKELLLLRETANFITLIQDAEKRNLARNIATATVGFTGLLPLVYAVQIGVLLAWAYVESILDVRALLTGKKIPFIKTKEQWNSDFFDGRKSIESKEQSKEDTSGLDYGSYLQMLLLLASDQTLNYRTIDLMEKNIRLTPENQNVRMDAMVQTVSADFYYEAKPLFWNFIFVPCKEFPKFSFYQQNKLNYGTF